MFIEPTVEWCVRTENPDHSYTYHPNYIINWGTRAPQSAVPYTRETAIKDIRHTTRYASYKNPTVVCREVVRVVEQWKRVD
jgi:hypothetical protein